MDIRCPYCETEYEVEKQDLYHYTKCEVCGKGFVIGATMSRMSSDEFKAQSGGQSTSNVLSSSASAGTSVHRQRQFAGNIGNASTCPSAQSAKFNWRNPFVLMSVAGMSLIFILITIVAVLYTSNRAKDAKMKIMLSTSYGEAKQVVAQETRPHTEVEASPNVSKELQKDVETIQVSEPVVKDEVEERNGTDKDEVEEGDETNNTECERHIANGASAMEVVEKLCSGERLTYREWECRLKRELGPDKLRNALKEELAKAGYWAIRIESPGMQINVGLTTKSTTGFICEGLGGGFTYPKWLPEEDATYIYKAFQKLDAEEKAFLRTAEVYAKAFKDSRFYITPEEEERVEQTARLEYAKSLFSSLSFIEKSYLYIQQRLSLSVVSAKITDRRWKRLQEAQSNEDWLGMMDIMQDDEMGKMMVKYPDKKAIASVYEKIINHKWNVEIKLKNSGVRTPRPWDNFVEIARSIKRGMKESEIVASYRGKENYEKYKAFKTAESKMDSNAIPYPIDIEVCISSVGRDGDIRDLQSPSMVSRRFKGDNTFNFQFAMSKGVFWILYVDDDWFWKQHAADSLRAKMSKYMNIRNKYYLELIGLADAVKQQQYGKREAALKHREIIERFRAPLLNAIADFMGKKSIVLPPMPVRLNEREDDNEDIEMLEFLSMIAKENRFAEYGKEIMQCDKELKEMERVARDNERKEKERRRRAAEQRRRAEMSEKYRLKGGPMDRYR